MYSESVWVRGHTQLTPSQEIHTVRCHVILPADLAYACVPVKHDGVQQMTFGTSGRKLEGQAGTTGFAFPGTIQNTGGIQRTCDPQVEPPVHQLGFLSEVCQTVNTIHSNDCHEEDEFHHQPKYDGQF